MRIQIKSELDSRPLLYPLIRSLFNHGSILVISSNRCVSRLIDGELEGGFRNVRIIVDETGSADDVYSDYGIAPGDYDFEILDNVGAIEYDLLLVPVSNRISEGFRMNIEPALDLPNTSIIHFGRKSKPEKPSGKRRTTEEPVGDYDPTAKWRRKTDEEVIIEKLSGNGIWSPFPSFQDIEQLESLHLFYQVERTLVQQLYKVLSAYINVDERYFTKEVTSRDESSGYISGTDIG